jgi:hypothetical protein
MEVDAPFMEEKLRGFIKSWETISSKEEKFLIDNEIDLVILDIVP